MKKQRLASLLLSAVLTLGSGLTAFSSSALTSGGFNYVSLGNGKARITGLSNNKTAVVIPATIGGLKVTEIGDSAFRNKNIVYVDMTQAVNLEAIGAYAFYENTDHLIENGTVLPASVWKMGERAFDDDMLFYARDGEKYALNRVPAPLSLSMARTYAEHMKYVDDEYSVQIQENINAPLRDFPNPDFNNDGRINMVDYDFLQKAFLNTPDYEIDDTQGDFNGNGSFDLADLTVLKSYVLGTTKLPTMVGGL